MVPTEWDPMRLTSDFMVSVTLRDAGWGSERERGEPNELNMCVLRDILSPSSWFGSVDNA